MKIKKLLIIILTLLISFAGVMPLFDVKIASAQTTDSQTGFDYCSYKSLKLVKEAFSSYNGVSIYKLEEIINNLYADGYFNLATRQKRLDYLRRNLKKEPLLQIILIAEYRDPTPDCNGITNISAQNTMDSLQKGYVQVANQELDDWLQIKDLILANCGKRGVTPSPDAPYPRNWQPPASFLVKSCWFRTDLTRFYQLHPEFQKYSANLKFTQEEADYISGMDQTLVTAGDQGIKDLTPQYFQDFVIYYLIPWGKILIPPVKLLFRAVVFPGLRLAGDAVAGAVFRTAEKVEQIISARIVSRFNGEADLSLNLTKIFKRSWVPRSLREWLIKQYVEMVNNIVDNRFFARYVTPLRSKGAMEDMILKPMITRKGEVAAEKITINDLLTLFKSGRYSVSNETFVHEFFHRMSIYPNEYACYYVRLGGVNQYPLYEGVTEIFKNRIFFESDMRQFMGSPEYYNQEKVAYALQKALQRKLGYEGGLERLGDLYFNRGLPYVDETLGQGVHNQLHFYMSGGRWKDAIEYLQGL